jgi:hypothetical protein
MGTKWGNTSGARAERRRRIILRHLHEHGEQDIYAVCRACADDPCSSVAVNRMKTLMLNLAQAGMLQHSDDRRLWRLRDGTTLCQCGAGVVVPATENRPPRF